MSRNAISANREYYLFKIFRGSMAPDPLERVKQFFPLLRGSKIFCRIDSPKQKILDRTLKVMNFGSLQSQLSFNINVTIGAQMNLK